MITGIDLNETEDYTLTNDKDNPTIWKIGVIPSIIFMKLASEAKGNEVESSYKILQIALKGWENFGGVEYKTVKETLYGRELDIVPLSTIEQIPTNCVVELATKVMEMNSVKDDESKN